MSYYAVDLFSSMPAGAPASAPGPAAALTPKAEEKPVEEPVKAAPKETIRVREKAKKKPHAKPVQQKSAKKPRSSAAFEAAMRAAEGENKHGTGTGLAGAGGAGAGIVADAGPAFPYPWYLKAIADKLDKQWHPPQQYQTDTVCQVDFVVHRNGQVTGSRIGKASGDTFFDQLAMRAVLYANPLPPLPAGFPDDTLNVHMRFEGK